MRCRTVPSRSGGRAKDLVDEGPLNSGCHPEIRRAPVSWPASLLLRPNSLCGNHELRTNRRALRVQGLTLCEIYVRNYRRFRLTTDRPTGQSDYRLPWRSSINAITAAITFSSSAILRMIAVEGSPGCRAASSIKACCAPLRRSSKDLRSAEVSFM